MRSLLKAHHEKQYQFRLRGTEITRLEAFSDAVFAIAITLLIFKQQMPTTYAEVLVSLRDVIPFGLCIVILISVWYQHFMFFVRYGLEDVRIVAMNALLLFILLIYVFPLKFLATFLTEMYASFLYRLFGYGYDQSRINGMFEKGDIHNLMIFYGLGIAAIYLVLAAMYRYALSQKIALELSAVECYETRICWWRFLLMAAIPILSAVIAWIWRHNTGGIIASGFTYFLYLPFLALFEWRVANSREKIKTLESEVLSVAYDNSHGKL